jgi:hypothetical protein
MRWHRIRFVHCHVQLIVGTRVPFSRPARALLIFFVEFHALEFFISVVALAAFFFEGSRELIYQDFSPTVGRRQGAVARQRLAAKA